MKKTIISLMVLFLSFAFSVAQTEEIDSNAVDSSIEPERAVRGFVIANDMFSNMEKSFQAISFSSEMASVTLSETQVLLFDPTQEDRLLPTLAVTLTNSEPFTEDVDSLIVTLGSLIETMQYLQVQFPDAFIFNEAMANLYDGVGLNYAIAEPEIWLWQESARAVMIPVCFYENGTGMLIDGMYLLEVVATDTGSLSYILLNDAQHVMDYMKHVTIRADNSPFQRILAFWYLQNHLLTQMESNAVIDSEIGTVHIVNDVGFVRISSNTNAEVIKRVRQGDELVVLSIAENGWYHVRCEDGNEGYISPKIVEFKEK